MAIEPSSISGECNANEGGREEGPSSPMTLKQTRVKIFFYSKNHKNSLEEVVIGQDIDWIYLRWERRSG
ncbi:hypothetical protein J6590_090904 [Homalodisca vitripennis]|nr:hypothetical protein J6590_090904 [Homalodisca vitripennis]